jgi:Putative prokaryotic signal transducing protein
VEAEEGVVLTVVADGTEADIVCGLLEANGIDCAYRDTEAIDSPLEDFTAAGPREILVREADLDAARALIADRTPPS